MIHRSVIHELEPVHTFTNSPYYDSGAQIKRVPCDSQQSLAFAQKILDLSLESFLLHHARMHFGDLAFPID